MFVSSIFRHFSCFIKGFLKRFTLYIVFISGRLLKYITATKGGYGSGLEYKHYRIFLFGYENNSEVDGLAGIGHIIYILFIKFAFD